MSLLPAVQIDTRIRTNTDNEVGEQILMRGDGSSAVVDLSY